MKQQYFNYELWEDYKHGMFRLNSEHGKDILVINAINLLKDKDLFYNTMKELIIKWEISTKHNLTNNQQNRRAWLGAASCCFKYNVPEYLTRIAWNLIDKKDQDIANETAEKIISEYELTLQESEQTIFNI